MVDPHAPLAHILTQTRQNVELLVAFKQISEADGEEILSRLSVNTQQVLSVASLTEKTQRLDMSPAQPRVEARTIWAWSSEDPSDLGFEAGNIIEVIAETNADWWTGRDRSGREGLFPSNYVEKLPPRSLSPILVPEPRKSVTPAVLPYSSPAPPQPSVRRSPQPYLPAPPIHGGYCPPAGPPPVNYGYAAPVGPPVPQNAGQQAPEKKNKFGGLGQVMAQSAASGAGFGAGAAIGSGIVNSIF